MRKRGKNTDANQRILQDVWCYSLGHFEFDIDEVIGKGRLTCVARKVAPPRSANCCAGTSIFIQHGDRHPIQACRINARDTFPVYLDLLITLHILPGWHIKLLAI